MTLKLFKISAVARAIKCLKLVEPSFDDEPERSAID